MPDAERELWARLGRDPGDTTARNRLVELHMPLAASIVGRICRRSISCLPFDDLLSAAHCALVVAVQRFDRARGYAFSTYATACIRGQIFSEIKRICGQERKIAPNQPLDENSEADAAMAAYRPGDTPAVRYEAFARLISDLTPRKRLILLLRYYGGRTFGSIAADLGLSTSRVSQLHAAALSQIRDRHTDREIFTALAAR